jgi:MFS family permease
MWVSVAALPVPAAARPTAGRPRMGELLPRFSDFRAAFRLALVPTIAFVVACSFLLNATLSMRFSFYVVYLESVGLTGTVIGFLYGTAFLAAAFAALAIRPLTRAIRPQWLLILTILVAVAGIAATPLLDGFLALFLLACFFGFGHGLTMALVHSVLTRVVAVDRLGVCIGLRITINRFSSLTIPVIMGLVVKGWDLAVGFYAMGALIGLATLALGIVLLRFPAAGRLEGEN